MNAPNDPVLADVPRRIRRRRGYYQVVIHLVSLLVLLLFAGLFFQIAFGSIRFLWFAELVQASVTRIDFTQASRGENCDLTVAYQMDGAEFSSKLRVATAEGKRYQPGDLVAIALLPERPDRPQLHSENYPRVFVTVLLVLFGLLPLAALVKLFWDMTVVPWRLRQVLRHGVAVNGVIVDKKEVRGRPPTYAVTYEYQVPARVDVGYATTDRITASMPVPWNDFQEAQIGATVVVYYCSRRPARSVIGQFSDYELIGQE